MGIETATYVTDLVAANPGSSDLRSQGDDHIRLIKAVLAASFPGASKPWYNPTTASKSSDFSVASTDMNKTFIVDTSGGVVNMTLPSLASGDAGWECFMVKTTAGVNPVMVKPPSGTLTSGAISGLSAARRAIPGARIRCWWSGTGFFVSRAESVGGPVGTCTEYHGATLPYGFEFPNGQTLASASTLYPEYNSVIGSGVTLDKRGRVGIALDNLGGSAAGRLGGGIITGTAIGNVAGTDTVTLSTAQLASHTHTGSTGTEDTAHNHNYNMPYDSGGRVSGTGNLTLNYVTTGTTAYENQNHGHSFTTNAAGSGAAHSNLQPSIMVSQLLVTE